MSHGEKCVARSGRRGTTCCHVTSAGGSIRRYHAQHHVATPPSPTRESNTPSQARGSTPTARVVFSRAAPSTSLRTKQVK